MFTEMRVAFNVQRAMATYRSVNGKAVASALVSVREVLECATAGGAVCAGLLDKCGTLTPGKEADIVTIRTDDINVYPSNHAIGTGLRPRRPQHDTVIIVGRSKTRGGWLCEHGQVPPVWPMNRSLPVTKAGYNARHSRKGDEDTTLP